MAKANSSHNATAGLRPTSSPPTSDVGGPRARVLTWQEDKRRVSAALFASYIAYYFSAEDFSPNINVLI